MALHLIFNVIVVINAIKSFRKTVDALVPGVVNMDEWYSTSSIKVEIYRDIKGTHLIFVTEKRITFKKRCLPRSRFLVSSHSARYFPFERESALRNEIK